MSKTLNLEDRVYEVNKESCKRVVHQVQLLLSLLEMLTSFSCSCLLNPRKIRCQNGTDDYPLNFVT